MAVGVSLAAVALLTIADQLIKYFVAQNLSPIGSAEFINGFVGWHYLENTGAAFGSFSSKTAALSVFTAVALAVGIYLIVAKKIKNKCYLACAVMVIAGGMGNLIDRIFRGYVIDYIELQFMNFAIFNFADILVSVGAFMIIAYMIYEMIRDAGKKSAVDKVE